jgi:hypothetical protein
MKRDCFKTCTQPSDCDKQNRCLRIGVNETVQSAKADAAALKIKHAPYGWIWLDDDGWEHDPNPQHPQKRGEAEYGNHFRSATAVEAKSPEFFRCPVFLFRFGA